nr:Cytochrome C oxidase, cbb3-type, subunit III [uncultured bacterium]
MERALGSWALLWRPTTSVTSNSKILARLLSVIGAALVLFAAQSSCWAKGDVKKGKRLFTALNCSLCHEDGGNNQNPDKPLKGHKFAEKYSDDKKLAGAIRKGSPEKGMPAYGKDQISDSELQDVVIYIRSLTPKSKRD